MRLQAGTPGASWGRRGRRLLALLACLAGCAGNSTRGPAPAPTALPGTGPPACFDAGQVQSFRVLDQSSLVIYAPTRNNAYYVRVAPRAPGLRDTERLAIVPPTGQICGYAGQILVAGPASLDRRFAILSVTRLSTEAEQALREDRSGEALPRPTPGPGAEVEPRLE